MGKHQRRGVGGSASYGALNTTQEVKKGCPGEQPSGEAEAFPRKESSPLRTRSESSPAWGLSSGKESSSQMETGRGLARHQDGEIVEALASEEL